MIIQCALLSTWHLLGFALVLGKRDGKERRNAILIISIDCKLLQGLPSADVTVRPHSSIATKMRSVDEWIRYGYDLDFSSSRSLSQTSFNKFFWFPRRSFNSPELVHELNTCRKSLITQYKSWSHKDCTHLNQSQSQRFAPVCSYIEFSKYAIVS